MGCSPSRDAAELDLAESGLSSLKGLKARLLKISVADNKLTDLPAEIGKCSKLVSLDVSGNQLTTLPKEIGECKALEELLCFKNQIKELPTTMSGNNLPVLKVLNLFNNKLRKIPDELGSLSSVREVNFAANKLMVVNDACFANWSSVKVRQLSKLWPWLCSGRRICFPSDCDKPSHTQILNLYDNNLIRVGSLEPLTALTEIRLFGNNLEEMPALGRCMPSHKLAPCIL